MQPLRILIMPNGLTYKLTYEPTQPDLMNTELTREMAILIAKQSVDSMMNWFILRMISYSINK